MADNAANMNCPFHADHENRIKNNENNVVDLDDRVTKLDKETSVALAKMTTAVEQLSKLPEIIDLMRQSLEQNNNETKTLGKSVDNLAGKIGIMEKRVTEIDNKDKVSILEWVKKNWFTIALTAGMLVLWLKQQGIV
jgi:DNA repair exonuclease SbcCD ATPase subunit